MAGPKFGVILSGCGVFDGAEIQEAVACLWAIDKHGGTYQCLAPKRDFEVIDHLTHKATGQTRDVLAESARIARGEIVDLAEANGGDFDAVVLPGGFGAAKNLCTFAIEGPNCDVDPNVARFLNEAHAAGRPIGFACIAPAVAAKVFGKSLAPTLTIGHDKATAAGLEKLGATHVERDVEDIAIDEAHRIVSTPCYMEAKRIGQVFTGCDKMVGALTKMAKSAPARV
ncbi:MAG: isoprenoid biosynthesis glyoxalase ElbB [Phycisphaerales bacterium]